MSNIQEPLKRQLLDNLTEHNPDLLFILEEEGKLAEYLNDRVSEIGIVSQSTPENINEVQSMNLLTADPMPSKFMYIKGVLEKEFEEDYHRFWVLRSLTTEIMTLAKLCAPIFEQMGFKPGDPMNTELYNAIADKTAEYLQHK